MKIIEFEECWFWVFNFTFLFWHYTVIEGIWLCSVKYFIEDKATKMGDEKDAFYVVRRANTFGVYKSLSDLQAVLQSSVIFWTLIAFHLYVFSSAERYLLKIKEAYTVFLTFAYFFLFSLLSWVELYVLKNDIRIWVYVLIHRCTYDLTLRMGKVCIRVFPFLWFLLISLDFLYFL